MTTDPSIDTISAAVVKRMPCSDSIVVLRHGEEAFGDQHGARDVWVFRGDDRWLMHYDAAGDDGWLAVAASSPDGLNWTKIGAVLEMGSEGEADSAAATYATTFFHDGTWHMFYLGTDTTMDGDLKTPDFPYMTMKATADSPLGPWTKAAVRPFSVTPGTYYSHAASPGQVIPWGDGWIMHFTAQHRDETGKILRTLAIAYTDDLNGEWTIADRPFLPFDEQVENSALYFEEATGYWFLFTNHIGQTNGIEHTDAIYVYWATDPTQFNTHDKAVVVDAEISGWSPRVIGLPSVVVIDGRLALYYDGNPIDTTGHGDRDIAVTFLDLPLEVPSD